MSLIWIICLIWILSSILLAPKTLEATDSFGQVVGVPGQIVKAQRLSNNSLNM